MKTLLLALILSSAAFGQSATNVDNDRVRVLSVVDSPGKRGGNFHEHKMNRVMIYLDEGSDKLTFQDGRVQEIKFKAGEVLWSPAGGMHRSENISGKPFRIVEIELKGEGKPFTTGKLDPVKVAPENYKVIIDNPQVRVLRVKIPAHGKVPLHEHSVDRVAVYLTPFKLRVTPETGAPAESSGPEAEVRFAGPLRHIEENISDTAFEVIAVELK